MEIDSAVEPPPQQQPSTADAAPESVNQTQSPSGSMGIEESYGAAAARFDDDEEEEGDVCRICRNPGDAENPLRYPCACSGSIKFVHQDCLLQWLNHSNARQCEVCKHPFSFSPVYSENAPARLPFQEFVVGMAMKTCHVLQFFSRLSFVLSVWLLIIPFITFWIWRLAFLRSFVEAQRLFLSHISTTVILTDCLHGFLLSASIVFIFLGATSLRDYFRHLRELGGHDAEREDDGDQNGARAARQQQGQANRNVAGEANAEDAGGAQGIAGGGQIIRRNAENVAARWEMQEARLEAHVEQMFDGLDDADGAEDVPFDELVGMQGPVFHLVENAFTVLASNMIFLGAVIFVPFSLGRIILYYISWLFSFASVPVLSTVMPLTDTALSLANITLKNALTAVANLTSEGEDSGVLGEVADMLNANASGLNEVANNLSSPLSADLLKGASVGASRLSDVTTLAIGYMFIFSLVFFYLGIIALIRYTRGEPLTMGRFYGIASIAETIPSLFRQFLAAMRHLMTMIKVAFLLVIELGVFPLMCGWWLDVCTRRMFGKSMAQRVQFFVISPLASSLVHSLNSKTHERFYKHFTWIHSTRRRNMHARHRSPGNGYRSGSMGVGMGASRISPDNSARGHGFYNSEYRSFNNRGFAHGQGHPKSFRQPPPQKGDILMEAGRLAAEYLVSKGLLPQSALSGKWQNGSFKRQAGDYQDFRQQEDLMQEGRTSAHSRLGSGASDAGLGRRRYPDDFNLRNHVKGRRRGEHYRGYSSEWGREYGRSGSLSDRNRMSPDTEENDTVSGHCEEQQVSNDVGDGMEKSGQSGVAPESEETADIESGLGKYNYPNETGSKASSSSVLKEETDGEPSKGSGDPANVNLGNKDMKDSNYDYEIEKQIVPEDLPIQQSDAESDLSGKDGSDLLTLSKFANVPTKMRSALSCRSSRVDQVPNNEEEDTSDNGLNKGSEDVVQDGVDNVSATDVNATHDSNCPNSEIIKVAVVQPAEDADEEGPEYGAVEGKCVRSHSFSDGAFMHDNEQESSLGLSGFGRSTSVKERGEKRAAESSGIGEAAKKPREWLSSLVNTADEHLHRTDLSENTGGSQEERASPDQQVTMAVAATQDSDISNCQFPRIAGEPGFKYAEEKQLFPSSFKIVDLNLMETSDINETHCSDPVLTYPSIMTTKREAPQVDIDLSISNSNVSGEYARHMSYGKQVEIIDLENDCTLEDKDFDNSIRKMETAFTGTEGFPSLSQNTGDITDVQVNYDGLMLAEFLNNLSNCTSVSDNITPLQNEMDLDNGEGTLGDDDSIYMSLGEIPLSFIPAWEPPTPQEYEKPF